VDADGIVTWKSGLSSVLNMSSQARRAVTEALNE